MATVYINNNIAGGVRVRDHASLEFESGTVRKIASSNQEKLYHL